MEACSVSLSGVLAYEPRLDRNQNGDPRLNLTLKVQSRRNATRWIKVRAYALLAVRAAESLHEGDCITVRGDDLDSWGKVDDRPAGQRFRGSGQDDGPRVQSWVYVTAYDIALSCRNDTATSGQTARRASQPGENPADDTGSAAVSAEEQANREVLAGVGG